MAVSSIRLLPTHSSVLRRSPVSTTASTGPTVRPRVAATSARKVARRSRSPSAHRSRRLRPTSSSGWIAKVRAAAGEANRSRPSASAIMITSDGMADQRGVASLDEAGCPPLPEERVVAQQDALAHHDERGQHEDDGRHHVDRDSLAELLSTNTSTPNETIIAM